jgi:hypothetical protein
MCLLADVDHSQYSLIDVLINMPTSLLETVGAQRFLKKGIADFSWCVLWQYQPIMFFAGLRLFLFCFHVIVPKKHA